MIASETMTQVLLATEKLARLIVDSEEAHHYKWCKQQMQDDQQAQNLIRSFVDKKEKFAEVERFGKYHPDYQTVNQEMREWKRNLDMHPSIAAFKKAEKELESILQEVSRMIAYAVSEEIKVPNGNPFWDLQGCGGKGCGSGGCQSCG